ncbi:MAG: Rho termination factor N-terminal domain-containing protein [Actinomycetota bacterium]|nr:Rho termination factor N-terminal domain-containing protein [Actinomycetota bacterium]
MSVLQRQELEDSPLADLHAIASELTIEGYRALRREDLIAAILKGEGGEPVGQQGEVSDAPQPRSRGRSRSRSKPRVEETAVEPQETEESADAGGDDAPSGDPVTGTLDILPNGSGFIRAGGLPSEDVYVSPAQIRRCELRAGDEVSGSLRRARRSERHPSLVRVEQVNGRAAEPPEDRPHFDDLTPVHPTETLPASKTLKSVPFGKGSRVAVAGGPGAGATRLLREIVSTMSDEDAGDLQVSVVLVGVRPEEVTDWARETEVPVTGGSFYRSIEAQAQAAELAVERAKRVAERGGDAVVVIDSLEGLAPGVSRRVFGSARNLEEGGSLTVIASTGMVWEAQRQASTRIALDPPEKPGEPKVSDARSGTLRADLLG